MISVEGAEDSKVYSKSFRPELGRSHFEKGIEDVADQCLCYLRFEDLPLKS
jgi:hypothetical protein